uniref:Uncharacterized protein n=1 Tax=Plectus sambesii TaxID=2011161 RepID=A0A914W5P8_9BILA
MFFLYLNVGGTRYRLKEQTIWNLNDNSLLYKFSKADHCKRVLMCDAYFEAENEYFFERPAYLFNLIFDYYITGMVTLPADLPRERVAEEFRYWQINVEPLNEQSADQGGPLEVDEFVEAVCCLNCRRNAQAFLDLPRSGILAFVYHALMAGLIVISVLTLALRAESSAKGDRRMALLPNRNSNDGSIIGAVEFWIMLLFALDLIGRFCVHPSKGCFLRNPLAVIDVFTVVSYIFWASLSRLAHDNYAWTQMLVLFMSVRVLKLARYCSHMRRMASALLMSRSSILSAFLLIFVGGTMFSFAFLWTEAGQPNTPFASYYFAMWYSVQTMTTIGYNNVAPVTFAGRVNSTCLGLYGIACIACTISSVVRKYLQLSEQDAHNQQINYSYIKKSPSMHNLDQISSLS